jgi:hypothetical protein
MMIQKTGLQLSKFMAFSALCCSAAMAQSGDQSGRNGVTREAPDGLAVEIIQEVSKSGRNDTTRTQSIEASGYAAGECYEPKGRNVARSEDAPDVRCSD